MVYSPRTPFGIIVASLCSMAIIAFTYFVIVKPQMDNVNDQVDKSFERFAPDTTNTPGVSDARKLSACIDRASGNVTKIERCTDKYR